MNRLLIIGLLIAVSLSGCANEAPANDADEGPDDAAVPLGGNTTDLPNLVPILNVTADFRNGTAPLLVLFTLSVQDDSENLTWAFTVNGSDVLNGTGAEAAFNHTFEAGVWNATVSVFDGIHTVNETLGINAFAEPGPGPGPVAPIKDTYEGGFTLGAPYGCALVQTGYSGSNAQRGVLWDNFQINQATWGQEYTAAVSATAGGGIEVRINAAGNNALIVHSTALTASSGTFTGTIPDGTEWIFWRACGGTDVTVTWSTGV